MSNKFDFDRVEPYWKAWWAGEMIDRVALSITAPIKKDGPPNHTYSNPFFVHNASPAEIIDRYERGHENTFYGGLAIPHCNSNLGPDVFSAFLGADIKFSPDSRDTSWIDWSTPLLQDYSDLSVLEIKESNPFYRKILDITREAAQRSNGRYLVGATDLHAGFDALTVLRGGPQIAAMDLVENPEGVQMAMKKLYQAWQKVFDDYWAIVKDTQKGSTNWIALWSPGKMYTVQADFSCLVSNAMFKEFFLEELVSEINHLDHSIYHLDGVECVQHLDTLLDVPRLNAVQWVRGARYESESHERWYPLYKKIQAKKKAIVIYPKPEEIPSILENLKPEGLLIQCFASSVEEAKAIMKQLGW